MSGEHPARITSSVMGSMVWFIGLVVFLFPQVSPVKAAAAPKRILVLYWYNKDFPSNPAFDRSFQAALKSAPAGSIEYYSEYLESDRFPEENQSEVLRDYLRQKYASRPIDVVVAVSDVPLEFLLKYRDSLFPRTPIVFVAIKPPATNEPSGPGLTGIVLGGGYRKTLDLALRLHPGTKQVFIISGTLNHDKTYETLCREEFQGLDSGISINYFTDLSLDELIFKTKRLPERSLVLYIWQQSQNKGQLLESSDILAAIAPSTTAPIYGVVDWQVGRGVVGGYLRTLETEGTRAGEIALRIANGARPQDIPIESAPKVPIFDWRVLHRWRVGENALPPGSVVLNRQLTVWEAYQAYIVAGITLILLETLLIVALLWQRKRRRAAETELVISSERLRLAVEAGKSVGWEWDAKTGINRWFGDLQAMFGIESGTHSGQAGDFQRAVYPEDRDLVQQAIKDAERHQKPYTAEFRVVRTDGMVRWVTARGKFYYTNTGDPARMLGMAVDITERRKAEDAVRESEERFRLIANVAPVMIWMSGLDKLCDYVNLPWIEFTGRTLEAELGNGWSEGVHPDDLKECLDTYTEAFDRRGPLRMQYRLRRHDGKYCWLLDIGVPRFAPDGSFVGYIGCCVDITERKAAEEAMASVSRRLIEAQELERTWIARELHDDINQQIALLSVELVQWDKQSPESASALHTQIRHATERLSDIGKNIQALSHRLHSSKLEYLGIVKAANSFCREISEKHKVHVEFSSSDIPPTIPKEIALCLFRVLQEALQNAVKHSGARQFHVELRGTSGEIRLTVSDHGVGFDWHVALDRQGLGLISMRERLQLVNGELLIESEHGQGTTIHARAPLRTQERDLSLAG
jgi:PAS domain S-box-containing protein